tara:strand:- start:43 stop:516 length:474 start_codon:yes stop_codon:yes gene_type:complete
MIKINERKVKTINISGRGGKEALLSSIFPSFQRKDAALYDLVDTAGNKIELKKQRDVQWFDAGKYHNLSDEQKLINMVFVMHEEGKVQQIMSMTLGSMLEILTTNKTYKTWGWEWDNIKMCHLQKTKFPTQQAKIQIKVKKFFNENKNSFNVLWKRG